MRARPSILNNRRSYEDYLDNQVSVGPGQEHACHADVQRSSTKLSRHAMQITATDIYYLEDVELARSLVELG